MKKAGCEAAIVFGWRKQSEPSSRIEFSCYETYECAHEHLPSDLTQLWQGFLAKLSRARLLMHSLRCVFITTARKHAKQSRNLALEL